MHIDHSTQQIRYRRVLGPKAGLQDTLSLKRFGLSDREFRTLSNQVESILQAQRQETPHLRSTHTWIESIPRKLRAYMLDRLLAADPEFVCAQQISLEESIDLYGAHRQEHVESTVKTDQQVIADCERLLDRCPSDVTRIDEGILADLLSELADEHGYAANTLARVAKNWSTFFAWLQSRKSIPRNPCDALPKTIGAKSKDEVRPEWVDRLVAACSTIEERYWLRLVQWTGCRLREGLSLRVGDIEVDKSRITFTETKNSRLRVNPIYPAIAEYLPKLLDGRDGDERVLRKITAATCYAWLYDLIDRCGLQRWQPPYNAFRATRANQLAADKSITPQQAGLLLGHSATVARRNYLSVEDSLLERLAS